MRAEVRLAGPPAGHRHRRGPGRARRHPPAPSPRLTDLPEPDDRGASLEARRTLPPSHGRMIYWSSISRGCWYRDSPSALKPRMKSKSHIASSKESSPRGLHQTARGSGERGILPSPHGRACAAPDIATTPASCGELARRLRVRPSALPGPSGRGPQAPGRRAPFNRRWACISRSTRRPCARLLAGPARPGGRRTCLTSCRPSFRDP